AWRSTSKNRVEILSSDRVFTTIVFSDNAVLSAWRLKDVSLEPQGWRDGGDRRPHSRDCGGRPRESNPSRFCRTERRSHFPRGIDAAFLRTPRRCFLPGRTVARYIRGPRLFQSALPWRARMPLIAGTRSRRGHLAGNRASCS